MLVRRVGELGDDRLHDPLCVGVERLALQLHRGAHTNTDGRWIGEGIDGYDVEDAADRVIEAWL